MKELLYTIVRFYPDLIIVQDFRQKPKHISVTDELDLDLDQAISGELMNFATLLSSTKMIGLAS